MKTVSETKSRLKISKYSNDFNKIRQEIDEFVENQGDGEIRVRIKLGFGLG